MSLCQPALQKSFWTG